MDLNKKEEQERFLQQLKQEGIKIYQTEEESLKVFQEIQKALLENPDWVPGLRVMSDEDHKNVFKQLDKSKRPKGITQTENFRNSFNEGE